MTDAPVMTPSAEERIKGYSSSYYIHKSEAISLLESAFRDGVKAERERFLKMLRDPSPDLIDAMSVANCNVGQVGNAKCVHPNCNCAAEFNEGSRATLSIIRDSIEADPT